MKKPNKMIILFIVFSTIISPLNANMPVIDITAIAQAITEYTETVKNWNMQIQQWKSEFDRIERAAKGLSSGDFTQILASISSLSKQASGWYASEKLLDDVYLARALDAVGDGSYSLLNLMNNSELLVNKIDLFTNLINKNIQKANENVLSSENWLQGVGAAGSGVLGTTSSTLTMITSLLKSGGDIATNAANIFNDASAIFNVSPNDYADLYTKIRDDAIREMSGDRAKTSDDFLKLREEQLKIVEDAEKEKSKLTSEDSTAILQVDQKIKKAEALAKEYLEMYDWATAMDTAISNIRENEEDYEKKQAEETRVKNVTNAAITINNSINEMEKKLAEKERKKFEELDEGINANLAIHRTETNNASN